MKTESRTCTQRRRGRATLGSFLVVFASSVCATPSAAAALPSDFGVEPVVAVLPSPPSKHWVWANDIVFSHMADGLAHLVDGDTGRYLGTLSTGYSFSHVVLPRDGKLIYAPETYFSRGTRGTRTDVVTIYDAATLKVQGEVQIPPKRSSSVPAPGNAGLTDDDRFLLVYNFNPAQSVSIVDMAGRAFVEEIETPGCALAFPAGPRRFFSICADGGFLNVELDDTGHTKTQARTEPMFDAAQDPVAERPVRAGDRWYFVSHGGRVYEMRVGKTGIEGSEHWWLTTAAERTQGWRPGGVQQVAVHAGQKRLYVIMGQGGRDTRKDPGRAIWVYDLTTHRRIQKIHTAHPVGSIKLSDDDHPLLYGMSAERSGLDVYDPRTGLLLRSVADVGTTLTLLVTP
jgi:methylamine dehydrogenase heavy chain